MSIKRLSLLTFIVLAYACSNEKVIERYDSGAVKVRGVLENNQKNGSYRSYYENGVLKSTGFFRNDQKHGLFTFYDSTGVKIQTGLYQNNLREGKFEDYYPDGKLKGTVNFKSDVLDGESVQYFPNGDIRFQTFFEEDSTVFFEEFDADGKLVDWKMDFSIDHKEESSVENTIVFELNNIKYNGVRVDLQIYEGAMSENNLLVEITKGHPGSILEISYDPRDLDTKLILAGKIMDMEILEDSSQAVVKNIESFVKILDIKNESISN